MHCLRSLLSCCHVDLSCSLLDDQLCKPYTGKGSKKFTTGQNKFYFLLGANGQLLGLHELLVTHKVTSNINAQKNLTRFREWQLKGFWVFQPPDALVYLGWPFDPELLAPFAFATEAPLDSPRLSGLVASTAPRAGLWPPRCWRVGEKKPLSATPGENPDRRDRAEVTLSGLHRRFSRQHLNPTSEAGGSAIPCPAAGLAHDHPAVDEVGIGETVRRSSAAGKDGKGEDQLFHHHLLFARKPPGCADVSKQYCCVNNYLIMFKYALDNIKSFRYSCAVSSPCVMVCPHCLGAFFLPQSLPSDSPCPAPSRCAFP